MRENPFDSMERLFDQMRREMTDSGRATAPVLAADADWDAGISIEGTDDGFVVLADLPGFERDELSIRLHDDHLHLRGEHEVGSGMEYRSRTVSESVRLPERVDPDHATATYRNGVLEVSFAVDSADGGTEIDIE